MKKNIVSFVFACSFALLTACGSGGGGGGSSSTPAPTPTATNIPFQFFPTGNLSNGYTETHQLTGSDSQGGTYTATFSETTQAQTTYNSQPAIPIQGVLNITNTQTNAFVTVTSTDYFSTDITSLMYLGYTDSLGDIYTPLSLNIIPQTVMIGDSGTVGTYTGSGNAAGETVTYTWQLTNANNGFANLITTSSTFIGGNLDTSEKHTTVIDQQGNPQSLKIEIYYASSGATLTLSGN